MLVLTPSAAASYCIIRKRSWPLPFVSFSWSSGITPANGCSTTTSSASEPANPAAYRHHDGWRYSGTCCSAQSRSTCGRNASKCGGAAVEPDVVPVERRVPPALLEVVTTLEEPRAVVERREVGARELLGQLLFRQPLEVRAELLRAVLAEAPAVPGREQGQVGLVELDPGDAGIDLDPDDRLQVLAPHRAVAIHQVGEVLAVGRLHPLGMERVAVDVAGGAFLEEVGDHLALGVHEAVGEVVLERLPQLRVRVLRELPKPEPTLLPDTTVLVHREHLALVLAQLDGELPALDLEDDAEDLDP